MNIKDSSEKNSKSVLDWLDLLDRPISTIMGIGAALAAIFALFFQSLGDNAQRITLGVAGILAIASGVLYIYQYRRRVRSKTTQPLETVPPTAALRGLLPFEEGDELPGRRQDVLDIFTLVSSRTFRFGVLFGESGCGKTSLLQAGLVPKLRDQKFLPLYINRPMNDLQEAIHSALMKDVPSLERQADKDIKQLLILAAPKGKKIVILLDQFEEFFLRNRITKSRAGFIKWLSEIIADENVPVVFLISIRSDFFAHLQRLAPQIPEPTSTRITYELRNFDTEQAKQIFTAAAKVDGVPFELELIQAVIRELETEDLIRPAELQVVGTRLKRKNVTRLSQYEALGGARGILSSYISDEIRQSREPQVARLVARLMCADTGETKSPNDLSLSDIVREISEIGGTISSIRPKIVQAILNQFVAARILIHTEEDKYNLVHDYLAPYVRTATAGTETKMERANRLLKRYIAEYKENRKSRIPFRDLLSIQKYASAEAKNRETAQELIKKSKYRSYTGIIALAMPIITLLFLYFLYLTNAYYLSVDNSYIVLRAGSPQFTFLPGFGQVIIQTDLKREDLIDENRNQIDQGKVRGFLYKQTDSGYQLWGDQSLQSTEVLAHVQMLRWLNQHDDARNIAINTIADQQTSHGARSNAVVALETLVQVNPAAVTPDILPKLITIVTNPEAGYEARTSAADVLGTLAKANPTAVTPEHLPILISIVTDSEADSSLRSRAAEALGALAEVNPAAVTPDMLPKLVEIITNPQGDFGLRSNAADALASLAQVNPAAVTPDMLPKLITIVANPQLYPDVRSRVADSLWTLAQAYPPAVTTEMLTTLIEIVTDPQADPAYRSSAADALASLAQANPAAITVEILLKLIDAVTDSEAGGDVHSHAANALGSLAQANPAAITPDMLPKLLGRATDPEAGFFVRSLDVYALGTLAEASPDAVTPDMLPKLITIITDPQTRPSLRSRAVDALGTVAETSSTAVTTETLGKLIDIVADREAHSGLRSRAADTLGTLAQANPEAVTPDMLPKLITVVTDAEAAYFVRSDAAEAVGSLAQTKPGAVTADMLATLINIVTDTVIRSDVRAHAAGALGSLAQAKPGAVTADMLLKMMDIVMDPEALPNLRSLAASVLGSLAKANPEIISAEMLQHLFATLKVNTDSPSRKAAAYALFSIAFSDSTQEKTIRQELMTLSSSAKPHWRIAANRTIEMLQIGNLVEEARAHPDQIQSIKSRLNYLSDLNESLNEQHLQFAAQIVLQEITQIEKENR